MEASMTPGAQRGFSRRHLFMVVIAVACGVAGAFGAVFFRGLIELSQAMFYGGFDGILSFFAGDAPHADDLVEITHTLPWWRVALAPAAGGALVGPLVWFFAREAKGHGVPEVMEAVAMRGGVIRPRVVIVKTLASALSIGSGGSVGREGPIVQIGSAVGSVIAQILRMPPREMRTIVACGAAAGIAATFNAPIAGALFAVEIILGDFAAVSFTPIVIASVVATVISRGILGDVPAFEVPHYELVSGWELVPYIGVGVAAGLAAVLFQHCLHSSEDFFERLRVPGWAKASLGGLLVGGMGAAGFPHILGVGYGSITAAMTDQLPILTLLALLAAKIISTSLTVGSGGSGGIFAPSLFMGAMLGGVFGSLIHGWFPESTATGGSYALVTMGGFVAAATWAPITAIIMIFELTSNYTIVPALMATCVTSVFVATALGRDSVYTAKLHRRGIDLSSEEDPNVLRGISVIDVIDREPERLAASADLQTVVDRIVQSDHTEIFVVGENEELLGTIYLRELRRLLPEINLLREVVVAEDLLEKDCPYVTEDDDLAQVLRVFTQDVFEELPVLDDDARLVGSVHKRDVLEAYNQGVLQRDLAGSVSHSFSALTKVKSVELGGGFVLQELQAPASFHGKSLADLDVARRSGVQVLLVRRHGETNPRVPRAFDRFEAGDRLVVAGTVEAVESLHQLRNH
ncbi:MAG: chloride channel protein [Deltaproteobacteria bacterium]|nr:chloride channel protein [Deltaproteobacteria bacterium]